MAILLHSLGSLFPKDALSPSKVKSFSYCIFSLVETGGKRLNLELQWSLEEFFVVFLSYSVSTKLGKNIAHFHLLQTWRSPNDWSAFQDYNSFNDKIGGAVDRRHNRNIKLEK